VRSSLSCSSSSFGGLPRWLMRVLAAAIYSILPTLPAIASRALAPTADAAAEQPGSSSSLSSRAAATVNTALNATGGITGSVTAAAGGAGLSKVRVGVFGTSPYADWLATTGPDGTWTTARGCRLRPGG
jgi:hypothetical protein